MKRECEVAVVGGGPAGLRAAEVLSAAGRSVTLFEAKASVGRKFLVAGSGGLNLTHSESLDSFVPRYGEAETSRWQALLAQFSPSDLRAWALELGIETFVGTSGRVFPAEKKAAPLLRHWVARLRRQGVRFQVRHQWQEWTHTPDGLRLRFTHDGTPVEIACAAAVLALGGASWPQTGSDGTWTASFLQAGIALAPWQPANCGYHVAWTPELLAQAEGLPLKNIAAEAGGRRVEGDCVITRYGLEGGPLYRLGPHLRAQPEGARRLILDFKPSLTRAALLKKWGVPPRDPAALLASAAERWRLGPAAVALLRAAGPYPTPVALLERVKHHEIALGPPRPLAEAISSAGGLPWNELNDQLMLRAAPGLFAAGEMIDWEAPTGGYLLQGCFTTGTAAARGVLDYLGVV